jgi:hypothetical protein
MASFVGHLAGPTPLRHPPELAGQIRRLVPPPPRPLWKLRAKCKSVVDGSTSGGERDVRGFAAHGPLIPHRERRVVVGTQAAASLSRDASGLTPIQYGWALGVRAALFGGSRGSPRPRAACSTQTWRGLRNYGVSNSVHRSMPAFHLGTVMSASRVFVFETEHVQAMDEAFDAVCGRLELSSRSGDHGSELVARRIIELAIAGERNADRLIVRTLADFGVGNDGWLWRH